MVRLYGKLSVDGPAAVSRYRQKHGISGSVCEITITSNPRKLSNSAPCASTAENTMKIPKIPIQNTIDERAPNPKLGKLIYTIADGVKFTAYHSVIFPKIVDECDKIVYPNKESWYKAMSVTAPVRCD